MEIAHSISAFMRDLGLAVTGGQTGSIARFKEQLNRLAATRMQLPFQEELATAVLKVYPLPPTARPLRIPTRNFADSFYKESLGELGYPGFAYLNSRATTDPAELLLRALDEDELDTRVVESLPWLPFRFPYMNWEWW